MEQENPYAPPVETSDGYDGVAEGQGGLSVSGQGWEIVAGMSKWMRIVSTLQYIGGALLAVVVLVFIALGTSMLGRGGSSALAGKAGSILAISTAVLFAYAILLFFGATWLRQAARQFYDGILSDAEMPLAQGFRKLRLYLILYGVFGVLGLVGKVAELLIKG